MQRTELPVGPAPTGLPWLLDEAIDHFLPWNRGAHRREVVATAIGVGIALAVTVVWVLAALGQVRQGAVIGWWTSWSVLEVLIRLRCKPWVKEGPWWRREFRPADPMDMIAYVSFKNLLIGASFFLVLKWLGALVV